MNSISKKVFKLNNFNDWLKMKESIIKIMPHFILKWIYNFKKHRINKFYKGDKVQCTICNATYKLFRPYGLVERKNARCPNCDSLERHRLLRQYLVTKTDLFKSKAIIKVLHFAPEPFFYKIFDNMEHIDYIACDLFPENYKYFGNTKIQKMDITDITFDSDTFDFILCNHVLEHVIDDKLAISELYRVMKKGGFGIFQVPIVYSLEQTYEDITITSREQRLEVFGQEDHVRCYGTDYLERLEHSGFNVIVDNFVNTFSNKEIFKYGFSSDELIYRCNKV